MANSKIPNLGLGDTLNSQRLRFNQLLDSVGDISTLTAGSGGLVSALNAVDSNLGTVDSNMGTDARTLGGAIRELNDRLDSIQSTKLLSPSATLSDSSATNIVRGGLQVDTNLHVGGNTTISGSLRVDGIATLNAGPDGNINIGDSGDSDTVTVNAEFASSLIPDTDGIYDIGDSAKKWNKGFFTSVDFGSISADSAIYTGNLTVQGLTTVDSINSTHLFVSDSTKLSGMMDVYATPTFYSATTFKDSISVTGNITTPAAASVGSLVVDSSFTVNGITNLDSVNVVGPLDVTGVLTVSQDFSVGGTFTVVGAQLTEASFYQVLSNQALDSDNRGGLSVFRQGTDSAILQWNEAGDYWEAGVNDSLNNDIVNRLALQNDSAAFSRIYQTGTGALRLPAGTTSQRPSDSAGASVNGFAKEGEIRFNQTNSNFEGYDGNNWSGLGGIIDADQDTKIVAAKNGSDSDTLTFITGGVERARLNDSGMHVTPTLNATTVAATVVTADSATFTKINVPTLGTSTIDVDSATFDLIRIGDTTKTISKDGSNRLAIVADSSAKGENVVYVKAHDGDFATFNEQSGTFHVWAPGLMRFQGTGADIEFSTATGAQGPGTISFQTAAGTSNDEGLKIQPSQKMIEFYTQDSSGAQIRAITGHNAATQNAASSIRYSADSHDFYGGGIFVKDTYNTGSVFSKNVSIEGNLTVAGTTTTVNSTQVELGDRIIELNSGIDSAATPTQDAGIEINRGIKDNAQFLFDESEKYWVAGEGDSNTKARVVTTNYLKFPGNDALSLDSATGTISHTGRNIPAIDASGGVKAINAVFDSNGHVTSFTVTQGGGLTADSVSGLSISGANDSAISIDSAGLETYFINKVSYSTINPGDSGSREQIKFNFNNHPRALAIIGESADDAVRLMTGPGNDLNIWTNFTGGSITGAGGTIDMRAENVAVRTDRAIHLIPGYIGTVGEEQANSFVAITSGSNWDAAAGVVPVGGSNTGSAYYEINNGMIKLIPGDPLDKRGIVMSDADLVLRNDPDEGNVNDGIYYVSNSGFHYFRKDNNALGHEGDDDPDFSIVAGYTGYGNGPSGAGHTNFFNDDSATMNLGQAGNFTIRSNVAHSRSYKHSSETIGSPNGATLVLWGSEGTPLDNQSSNFNGGIIGEVRFAAENSSSQDVMYASICALSETTLNSQEAGGMEFRVASGGGVGTPLLMNNTDMRITVDVDIDDNLNVDGTITGNGSGITNISASAVGAGSFDINGGSIDGTAIGSSSRSTGKFTTVDATGDITSSGDMYADAFYYNSDKRLKENVKSLNTSLEVIQGLKGVEFDWKADNKHDVGFIAQEIEELIPEAVSERSTDELDDQKTINPIPIIAHLVEAVKELKAEIETLKNEQS